MPVEPLGVAVAPAPGFDVAVAPGFGVGPPPDGLEDVGFGVVVAPGVVGPVTGPTGETWVDVDGREELPPLHPVAISAQASAGAGTYFSLKIVCVSKANEEGE